MSRRARSLAFLALALLAAVLAAGIAESYGSRVASGYGPLRSVVIATRPLPAEQPLRPRRVAAGLATRRVPERFAPPGALREPAEALGLAPVAAVPAGSYLLAAQLRPPGSGGRREPRLGRGRHPVQITVGGAEALLGLDAGGRGSRVDVLVTTEPSGGGPGRTYVAATAVPLLALAPGVEGEALGGTAAATLALTRRQALRLIAAESFARRLTLLAAG